jgi:hypothetical protein
MKYADLKAVMAEFHAGTIEREDMVAAIALWQRPVDITKDSYDKAERKYRALFGCGYYLSAVQVTEELRAADKRARAAVEAVIR